MKGQMPRVEFPFTAKNSNMAKVLQRKSIAVMIAFFGVAGQSAGQGALLSPAHCLGQSPQTSFTTEKHE